MTVKVLQGSAWKEINSAHVKDAGAWKAVWEIWVKETGTWKIVYGTPAVPTISHIGLNQVRITNYDSRLVYTAHSSTGTATVAGDIVSTDKPDAVVTLEVRRATTGPAAQTKFERKAHSFYTHTWTTGGSSTHDCSYGARAETYQSGTNNVHHVGDPCVGGACPPGWHCAPTGVQIGMQAEMRCMTDTSEPVYSTRYHCDNGGSLSGTTCVKTCTSDNTQTHSEQRLTDEPGYANEFGEWWKAV